jgi:hypothetical protein
MRQLCKALPAAPIRLSSSSDLHTPNRLSSFSPEVFDDLIADCYDKGGFDLRMAIVEQTHTCLARIQSSV